MVANTNRNVSHTDNDVLEFSSRYFMRAKVILADQFDEAFEPPEIDHQAAVNEVGAGMNGELVWEEAPFIQDVRTTDAGKAEPQEPTLNLSPFSGDGSIRADDFWLNGSFEKFQEEK